MIRSKVFVLLFTDVQKNVFPCDTRWKCPSTCIVSEQVFVRNESKLWKNITKEVKESKYMTGNKIVATSSALHILQDLLYYNLALEGY